MSYFLKFLSLYTTLIIIDNFKIIQSEQNILERFNKWVDLHKIVTNDELKFSHIYENWLDNDNYIKITNSRNLSYTVGHNSFSGMNTKEFSEYMKLRLNEKLLSKDSNFLRGDIITIPQENIIDINNKLADSIDWRKNKVVNAIQNQQSCGSCWAFSGISTLESATAIKYGKLYDLSEQQGVSCAGLKYGNLGCNGGYYSGLFDYSKVNKGICTEYDYPYTSGNGISGSCIKNCNPIIESKVSSIVDVESKSDNAMMRALNVGTVSIAIEADTKSFQLYNGGIYNDYEGCNSNSKTKGPNSQPNIDHAVVLVGYGSENNQDYYILRNSWGTSWGNTESESEKGYMKIEKSEKYAPYGICGILYDPMYPLV
jgi:C1A family cysteine protease